MEEQILMWDNREETLLVALAEVGRSKTIREGQIGKEGRREFFLMGNGVRKKTPYLLNIQPLLVLAVTLGGLRMKADERHGERLLNVTCRI